LSVRKLHEVVKFQVSLLYSGGAWFEFPSDVFSVYPDHPLNQKTPSSISFAIDIHPVPRRYILFPMKVIVELSANKHKKVFSFNKKEFWQLEN
jgi:hypothetical protein